MASELVGGLTPSEALSWWTAFFGTGWLGAAILAWITWQRTKAESRRPQPTMSKEGQQAIGMVLADRHAVEQIDRLHVLVSHINVDIDQIKNGLSDVSGSVERLFVTTSRFHTENLDRFRNLATTMEDGIDAQRTTRRIIEDMQKRNTRIDGQ